MNGSRNTFASDPWASTTPSFNLSWKATLLRFWASYPTVSVPLNIPNGAAGAAAIFSPKALSQFATIWRWRRAYQHDFAARMQWTVAPRNGTGSTNRQPVAVVNGSCATLEIPYVLGESVVLDASESWDPDGDDVSFDWFHYREPTFRIEGNTPRISPNVTFDPLNQVGSVVNVTPNDNEVSPFLFNVPPPPKQNGEILANRPNTLTLGSLQTMHILLTVEDSQPMSLVAYRRIILVPTN